MECLDDDFDPEYGAEHSPQSETRLSLPSIALTPTAFAGSCLALSAPLLAHLHSLLPAAPSLILSIGSGYGLLEALLLSEPYKLNIVGVEVEPSPNRYLLSIHHCTVPGTRFLQPLAASASAWLFVYPRRVGLVEDYLATHGDGNVSRVLWIGPAADWEEYEACFGQGWDVLVKNANEVGGRAWETIAVATRSAEQS